MHAGPSTQTDVIISADGISETITFPAGPSGSIFATFTITDDDVGLEAVESYVASLELVVPNDGILVDRNTTVINIEDDDGESCGVCVCVLANVVSHCLQM